jgi:hypothetical protein
MWAKQVVELGFVAEQTTWKTIEKHVQTQFTTTWTSIVISRVDDYFHHDFQMGFQAYMHKYMGVNLGCTTSKGASMG